MHENEIGTLIVDSAVHLHQDLGPGTLETVYEGKRPSAPGRGSAAGGAAGLGALATVGALRDAVVADVLGVGRGPDVGP